MAITIDNLEVQTQEAPAPPGGGSGGASALAGQQPNNCELRTAVERLRERDLRLQAD